MNRDAQDTTAQTKQKDTLFQGCPLFLLTQFINDFLNFRVIISSIDKLFLQRIMLLTLQAFA